MKKFTFLALLLTALCGHWSINAGPAAPIGKRVCAEILKTGNKGTLATRNSYQIRSSSSYFPNLKYSSTRESQSTFLPHRGSCFHGSNSPEFLKKYRSEELENEAEDALIELRRILSSYENKSLKRFREEKDYRNYEKNLLEGEKEEAELK